jgi:hypothetical protein
MASIEEILAQKKPATIDVSVRLYMDGDTDERVTFTFKALGRHEWLALVKAHPPTDEQQAEYEQAQAELGIPSDKYQRLEYNAETFPVALMAACCVHPEMTVEQAQALWDSEAFNVVELSTLTEAAMRVNRTPRGQVEWGKGSAGTRRSATSSESPANTDSPYPVSSDDQSETETPSGSPTT